jgi:hypothetical protein
MGILGGLLVLLAPLLSDESKLVVLIIGIFLLIEELVRHLILKMPIRQILLIVGAIIFTVPMIIIYIIENYYFQYQIYTNYLYIWCGVAFLIFYFTLMIWTYKNRTEMRKFIIIVHGLMLICAIMVVISMLLR